MEPLSRCPLRCGECRLILLLLLPSSIEEWDWSERYPSQPEVLRYLEHVADKFDLRKDIRFNTRVERVAYDEASARWHVRTDGGAELDAKDCVMAVGSLSEPKVPDIDGWDQFDGEHYFTARWPHDPVTFAGKRGPADRYRLLGGAVHPER